MGLYTEIAAERAHIRGSITKEEAHTILNKRVVHDKHLVTGPDDVVCGIPFFLKQCDAICRLNMQS